jgi:RNA polymerase sigma-70 factor (ECF subfamily)
VANERDRERAAKRGGGRSPVPIDLVAAETAFRHDAGRAERPDELFDRRFALTLLRHALVRLDAEQERAGRGELYRLLRPSLTPQGGDGGYAAIGAEAGMTEGAVKVAVHRLRRRLGAIMREEVARTLDDATKVEDELRHLMVAMAG